MSFRPGSIGKRDRNEREIINALKARGCVVKQLTGAGCDLLVGIGDCLYMMEVKDGKAKPSDRKLTTKEKEWIDDFCTVGVWLRVVSSVDEALAVIGMYP